MAQPLRVPRSAPEAPRARPAPIRALDELEPGARAVVHELGAPDDPVTRRLADLGFVPGTPVEVVRRAPLGDPVEYVIRGTRLCLRRSEAARIRVRPA